MINGSSLSIVSSWSKWFFANFNKTISLISAHIHAVRIARTSEVFFDNIKRIAVAEVEVNPYE